LFDGTVIGLFGQPEQNVTPGLLSGFLVIHVEYVDRGLAVLDCGGDAATKVTETVMRSWNIARPNTRAAKCSLGSTAEMPAT
jgi:hypothetical protein